MAANARGGMSLTVERALRTIFKRCVECPPDTPSCPATCPDGEVCSLVPKDCHTCARTICASDPTPPTAPPHTTNVGAIAGGVLGGIALIVLVVFLVYWFWIKKRRQEQDAELEEEWTSDEIASQKRTTQFTAMHDGASARTRGSLANSIISRASNIIQIAYIPGVTNRNGSARDSIHAPVPPIPAAHRSHPPKSPLSNEGDALFFRPGDLRDSTWSATSSIGSGKRDTRYTSNRDTRYTMASITPSLMRDSMASDIAWDDATTQPMPATAVAKVAPRMVSVKSNNSSESADSSDSPPTPENGKAKTLQVMMPGQSSGLSPTPSFRSTTSSGYVKAKQVTVGGKGRFPIRQASDASTAASTKYAPVVSSPLAEKEEDPLHDETQQDRARQSLIQNIDFSTPPAIQPVESPFFDGSEYSSAAIAAASSTRPNPYASMASTVGASTDGLAKRGGKGMGGLSAVIEEATKRASHTPSQDETGDKGDASPFSDDHATE